MELVEVKTLSAKVVVALHSAQRLQPLEVGAVLRGMLLTLVEGEEVAAVEEQEVREVITLVVLVATLMAGQVETQLRLAAMPEGLVLAGAAAAEVGGPLRGLAEALFTAQEPVAVVATQPMGWGEPPRTDIAGWAGTEGAIQGCRTEAQEHSLVVEEVAEVLGGVGALRVATVALGE